MRKSIFAFLIMISMLAGIASAQSGHGTHTPGTIGAVGNNAVGIGGGGRDVLIGGAGDDVLLAGPSREREGTVNTDLITFTGLEVILFGIRTATGIG